MKLWQALYATIWVVFLEFLLAMIPLFPPALIDLHVALGLPIVGITFSNFNGLRFTRCPGRIKRIAKASFFLTIVNVVLGLPLFFQVGTGWTVPVLSVSVFHVLLFVHITNAFAIITQVAAVAIAHDMWEDHEFEKETQPGQVPPMERPGPRAPMAPAT